MRTLILLAALLLAQRAEASDAQICWAWVPATQPVPEAAQRIAQERCVRGDALVITGSGIDPIPLAASFCDLAHPVTLTHRSEGAEQVHTLLCTYSGQRRLGRNGQERPRR